jgi:CHAT domain-containing protein
MDSFDIDPEMATLLHESSDEDLLDLSKSHQEHNIEGIELHIYTLFLLFMRTGSIESLEAAVLQAEGWVAETPDNHPHKQRRSNIYDSLLANMMGAKERAQVVGVNGDDEWYESLGLGVENNENLQYLIGKLKAWSIIASPEHPNRNAAMDALSGLYTQLFRISGDLSHNSRAIETMEEAIAAAPDDHIQQAYYFAKLARLLDSRYTVTSNLSDLNRAIDTSEMVLALAADDDYDKQAIFREFLGDRLGQRFTLTGEKDDIDRGISETENAVTLKTSQGDDCGDSLLRLDRFMLRRWFHTKATEDLNAALETRDFILSLDTKLDDRVEWLDHFRFLAKRKFDDTGVIEDLNRAIKVSNLAIESTKTEDHQNQILRRDELASLLQLRFQHTPIIEDLDQVIEIFENALITAPDHAKRSKWLHETATSLKKRFTLKQDIKDINRAIYLAELGAQEILHDNHYNRCAFLGNIAKFIRDRYDHKPTTKDLNRAIDALELALKIGAEYPQRLGVLSELAGWIIIRYKDISGSLEDMDLAIQYGEMSIDGINMDDSDQLISLINLGTMLSLRFTQTGHKDDLNRSVELAETAANALPPESSQKTDFLCNLAHALLTRYDQAGQQEDLKRVIGIYEVITADLSPSSPFYTGIFSSFGVALGKQFQLTESIDDLNQAVKFVKIGINDGTPASQFPSLRWLNFGQVLGLQYIRTGKEEDRDASIDATEKALALANHQYDTHRVITMTNLASALMRRFDHAGRIEDLDRAIELLNMALKSTPDGHHARTQLYFNFSACHERFFERTGKLLHLNQAVDFIKMAVEILPPSNADRARIFHKAGIQLCNRHRQMGENKDLDEACELLNEGLNSDASIPTHRIQCADRAGHARADEHNWEQSTFFFEAGLNLLPVVSPRSLNNSDKQHTLKRFTGLAARGGGAALNAKREAYEALALLELGRGVIAGLLLEMRTDITELKEKHPELAQQFTALRDELDAPGQEVSSLENIDAISIQKTETKRRPEIEQQFKDVIADIRSLPNFGEFLLPPTAVQMKSAASKGPIVIINVSPYRCDAFLVDSDRIRVLELPNLREDDVDEQALVLNAVGVTSSLLEWLWDVIAGPVFEALGFTQPPSDDNWSHLWWIPTGALSQLPLHAAGYHSRGSNKTVLDRVISSYSSSVKALIYGRRKHVQRQTNWKRDSGKQGNSIDSFGKSLGTSLLVGMTETPGLPLNSSLPYAAEEVKILEDICSLMGLETIQPIRSREEILKHMRTCTIFHFAGHGQTNRSDPSQSCLLLDDWETRPLTVGDLRDSRLQDNAPFLGYLSACLTGTNKAPELLDEGVHLISAFQLAGFRHVIGTLWEVSDRHCVDVARVLYETISKEGMTDNAVRRGLHRAIRALRDGYVEDKRSIGETSDAVEVPSSTKDEGVDDAKDIGKAEDITANGKSSTETDMVEDDDKKRVGRDAKLIVLGQQTVGQGNPQYWAPYVHFGP